MRYMFLPILFATLLCASSVWGNGDSVIRESDPRTGILFAVRKVPAQVKHQQLSIRFMRDEWVEFLERTDPHRRPEWSIRRVDVETTYTIYNPLGRTETLDIAFAVPGRVTFLRPPVLFDGRLIAWQYLDEDALWRMYFPAMLRSFEDALRKDERLHMHLEHAYQIYKQKGSDWEAQRYLEKQAPRLVEGFYNSTPVRIYVAYREKKPLRATDLARLLQNIGRTEALPWARWDARKRFLHPITGRLLPPEEMFRYRPRAALDVVTLLLFRITLHSGTTHRLTVRYSQQPGYIRQEGVGEFPLIPGVHLTYLLRTHSWVSYGPIDVEIKIPKGTRLRSLPEVTFAMERDGERIYRTRIVNPRGNLYITVADPDSFYLVPWQVVNARRGVSYTDDASDEKKARFINGAIYMPARSLGDHSVKIFGEYSFRKRSGENVLSLPRINMRWQSGRLLLEASGRSIEVRAGSPVAIVNGRQVALTKPPVILRGRMWLHVRDFFPLVLYLLDIPPKQSSAPGTGWRPFPGGLVRTHYDYREAQLTVILPF